MARIDHIVIDTNYFFRDPNLEFAVWNDLVTLQNEGRVKLYVPTVVFREHMRHEEQRDHQRINEGIEAYDRAQSVLSKTGIQFPTVDKADLRKQRDAIAARKEVAAEFGGRLRASGVTILPYPAVDAQHLADAYFTPTKPFKANGEGLADYLIWRSSIELLARIGSIDRVVFISSNTADFVDEGNIHPDLVEGFDSTRFSWHRDPQDYVRAHRTPAERVSLLAEREGRTREVESTELNLAIQAASAYTSGMLFQEISSPYSDWSEYEVEGYHPPHFFQNPQFDSIDLDEESAEWEPYDELRDGIVLGRLTVAAHVGIGAYVNKSDLAVYDGVSVIDFDHNDHMAEVADSFDAFFEFHVRVDGEEAEVLNVESIRRDGEPEYEAFR